MRILYHHRTLGDGAEGVHVASIVAGLRNAGHDVKVASLIGERTNESSRSTRILGRMKQLAPRWVFELLEYAYGAIASRALLRTIRAWEPDVVYERYSLFNRAGINAARRADVPLILEVNAPLAYERQLYERLTLRAAARRSEARICADADAVVVVSTPLKNHLVGQNVPPRRIVVVPNGADAASFQPDPAARAQIRQRHGIADNAVVVGFTGAPRPWHGLDLLFEAVARARRDGAPLHLLIVGDGPSVPDLARQVAESDLRGAVTFTGRLGHEQIPAYVASFDIGVSPRATFYASPMKVPEYMACGVATVAPRMSNLEDLITDGVDGCLFDPESVEDLANVLGRLAGDAAYRASIGSTARQAILEGRTWNDCATRIASVASHAVQARARRRLRARHAPVSQWKPAFSQRLNSIWVAVSTSVTEKISVLEWLKGSFPVE